MFCTGLAGSCYQVTTAVVSADSAFSLHTVRRSAHCQHGLVQKLGRCTVQGSKSDHHLLFCVHRYKGRPHWGKNFDRTFLHPKCPVAPMYPKFSTLVGLCKKYDPANLFRPRLLARVAKQDKFDLFPHCA